MATHKSRTDNLSTRYSYMIDMSDVFDCSPEITAKEKIIEQFGQWWDDDEIRSDVIPNVVGKRLRDSVNGALKRYSKKENCNSKGFAEILYDLVGQNFLVNPNKDIRINFLRMILVKKDLVDPSFQGRFEESLIIKKRSSNPSTCQKCSAKWDKGDEMHMQTLGLAEQICCTYRRCVGEQQKQSGIPKISDPAFEDFVRGFAITKDYMRFCKTMMAEFDFSPEVILRPAREIKLLPETIRPLGNFVPLHDYQASIGAKILAMLERYQPETSRALVVLPTGAGKTRLVVETLVEWINGGRQRKKDHKFVVWIVDKNELCQQAFDTFADVFRHRGRRDSSLKLHPIYGDNAKNVGDILYKYSEPSGAGQENNEEINDENGVIIGTIQSLYSISKHEDGGHLPELGRHTSVVIIDEAHHAVPSNKSYNSVLRALGFSFIKASRGKDVSKNGTCLIGLTATPFRGGEDGKGTDDLLNRFGGKKRILWPPFSDSAKELENIPPNAHLYVQKTAFENEPVKLYGEDSYDKDGRIVEYHFTVEACGDNSKGSQAIYNEKHQERNIDYTFENPGTYMIRLVVRDDEGTTSENSASRRIKVLPIEKHAKESNAEEMKRLYEHLIKREILSKPHHYIIDSKLRIELTEADKERFEIFHDITDSKIREIGNDLHRNHLILDKIESLVNKEDRKSVLFFACSVEHSKLVSFVLDAIYGIKSASIDHTTSTEERDETIHDFRTGEISVLCNYGILSTGFDSPKVDCVFISRPTFSHLLYNQMAGRGLRGPRSGGTSDCVIVDISDSIDLVLDKSIQQPWMFFDYIYKSVFDERKPDMEQKCYGCFGAGKKNEGSEETKCKICGGTGVLRLKIPDIDIIPDGEDKDMISVMKEIQALHPEYSLEQIKMEAKRKKNYDKIFRNKKRPTHSKNEWAATCRTCGMQSHNMSGTMALFGRSEDNVTQDNQKGINAECKRCVSGGQNG